MNSKGILVNHGEKSMSVYAPKLKTLAALVIGLSGPACALASAYNPAFNGFYGGIMGGVLQTNATISSNVTSAYQNFYLTAPDFSTLATYQKHVNLFNHNGIGTLDVGFGHFFGDSKYYWGVEIFGNWANRKVKLHNFAYHDQPNDDQDNEAIVTSTAAKLQNAEYGADFKPGYQIDTNTLLYARLGVAFNRITNDTTNDFIFVNTRTTPNLRFPSSLNTYNKQETTSALRLGLGVEHLITNKVAVTADYVYTYYGRSRTYGKGPTISDGEDFNNVESTLLNTDGLVAQ
jgi:opacity protein-like surface antigen